MFSHIMIGSNNIEAAEAFYTAVLGVFGAGKPMRNVNATGQTRLFYVHDGSIFCLSEPIDGQPASVANGMTIGFACDGPEQVLELHRVALANGATSIEQPPGPRESSLGGTVHLCYFRDPDGHKICGIYRPT